MSGPLPNPERGWGQDAGPAPEAAREAAERRLGPLDCEVSVLAGGLANLCLRVGDRVLRIHEREPASVAKERTLLTRDWRALRVPRVLDGGDDWLLLEHVPHQPLQASAEHGAACGRALAEIHAVGFEASGFLGRDARLITPLADVARALLDHARDQLGDVLGDLPVLDWLAAREDGLRAAVGAPVLLHGDFKASNLHWTDADRLLVLDWEFAWSGPALMDVGQLLRWRPGSEFADAFGAAYQGAGGRLPDDWPAWAEAVDLVNLIGLVATSPPDSIRGRDVRARVRETLAG